MKKLKISLFEFIVYILSGALALWGLTYVILGLFGQYLEIGSDQNVLAKANESFAKVFGLGFFGWGLIILAIAAVAAVIVLLIFSSKVDRENEKTVRRAQRIAQMEQEEAKLEQQDIIDAEVEPVEQPEEPQPEEQPVEEAPTEEEQVEQIDEAAEVSKLE